MFWDIEPEMWIDGRCMQQHYGLSLQRCTLTVAKRKHKRISIPAVDGTTDLLMGFGEPKYEDRTLRAEFESSGQARTTADALVQDLEGRTVPIVLPGYPMWYMLGEIHVSSVYAQGSAIVITAVCKPWKYSCQETVHNVPASDTSVVYRWYNNGAMTVVPELTVVSAGAQVTIGETVVELDEGTHFVPEMAIPGHSSIAVEISGGAIVARYREAVL